MKNVELIRWTKNYCRLKHKNSAELNVWLSKNNQTDNFVTKEDLKTVEIKGEIYEVED